MAAHAAAAVAPTPEAVCMDSNVHFLLNICVVLNSSMFIDIFAPPPMGENGASN